MAAKKTQQLTATILANNEEVAKVMRPTAKKPKQAQIPGTERKTVKEIDDAAAAYVEARDARKEAGEVEVEAKDSLIAVMKKHGVSVYRDVEANLVVHVVPGKDGVKVQELPSDDSEGLR
jgi:hypothetical protein